jgi:DDE domain
VNHFGSMIAADLRKRRLKPHGTWHLDEVYLKIDGRMVYLWRAVDAEGEVLDGHCQSKFYTACSRTIAGWSPTVFARELPPRSAGFNAENRLYSFALTMPLGADRDADHARINASADGRRPIS